MKSSLLRKIEFHNKYNDVYHFIFPCVTIKLLIYCRTMGN